MSNKKVNRLYYLVTGMLSVMILAVPVSALAGNIFFQGNTFCEYAKNVFNFGVTVAGILAVIAVIIGGSMYMTSGGNPEKMTKAKEVIFGAIIGLILVLVSWLIFSTLAPNILVCKQPQITGSAGGYNVPGGGTVTGAVADACAGRTTYGTKDECDKAKASGEECTQGKDNKWCATKCGDPQALVSSAKKLEGACVAGNHCAYLVGWALTNGTGCGKAVSASVTTGTFENDIGANGFKGEKYNGDPSSLRQGDILVKRDKDGKNGHAMLSLGGGTILHAVTTYDACGIDKSKSKYVKDLKGQSFKCEEKLAGVPGWENHGPGNYSDDVKTKFTNVDNPKPKTPTSFQCITTTPLSWGYNAGKGDQLMVYRKQQ